MPDADQLSDLRVPLLPFTRDGYRCLVTRFLDADYTPVTFESVRRESRHVILRHDIDLSLEAAVTIAELEYEMGVQATYFVMVSSAFYNVFSPEGRRLIDRLGKLRHQIGLHFDISVVPSAFSRPDVLAACNAAVTREFRALASIVDRPIEIMSLHHVPPELINRGLPPDGPSHTYEPRFFSELEYVADSGGRWRFGAPFERLAFRNGTAMHLLTHPIWWAHDAPTVEPGHTLANFAARSNQRFRGDLARGFKPYREFVEGTEPSG